MGGGVVVVGKVDCCLVDVFDNVEYCIVFLFVYCVVE